ncbi:MAG TPA: hypothetical protein VFJ19_01765 [Nocardioidaceae bacterium]|nr:hypothetical protein [Nocardioidaceae bacterium]
MPSTGTVRRRRVALTRGLGATAMLLGVLVAGSGCASVQESLNPTVPVLSASASPAAASGTPSSSPSDTTAPAKTTKTDKTHKSSTRASAAPRLGGEGYSFALPSGWADATSQFKSLSPLIDVAAKDTTGTPGRAGSNINVIVRAVPKSASIDDGAKTFYQQLKARSKSVRRLPDTQVAGARSLHFVGIVSAVNLDMHDEQFDFIHGSHLYVVTVTFPPTAKPSARSHVVHALVDSWSWRTPRSL